MLAVGTSFFLALSIEKGFQRYRQGAIVLILIILIGFGAEATSFYAKGMALQDFPGSDQGGILKCWPWLIG